jgi:aminoglycoside 6'-N-acetyltransferase I
MPITIRKMNEVDITDWAQMRRKLWDRLSLDEHTSDIERMLRSNRRFGYAAIEDNQRSIGFAEICIREYANGCTHQPVPFLEGIWVAAKFRRQGTGRALITKITGDLLCEGFRELCSDAGIRNRRSHLAHGNWGFEETDRVVYFRKALI